MDQFQSNPERICKKSYVYGHICNFVHVSRNRLMIITPVKKKSKCFCYRIHVS